MQLADDRAFEGLAGPAGCHESDLGEARAVRESGLGELRLGLREIELRAEILLAVARNTGWNHSGCRDHARNSLKLHDPAPVDAVFEGEAYMDVVERRLGCVE